MSDFSVRERFKGAPHSNLGPNDFTKGLLTKTSMLLLLYILIFSFSLVCHKFACETLDKS